jgi:hypothetical protein
VQRAAPTIVFVLATAAGLAAAVEFTSTWKSPDAGSVSFAGKRVAALVISQDDSLRVAGEEGLVAELGARGMQGVATYRIAPKEELQSAERAKGWFEKAGVEGVVAVRPVSAENRKSYTPGMWVSSSYNTLWGYYGYGWSSVYIPGSSRDETIVIVESTIYSVPRNQLLWGGVSETRNPKDLRRFVEDLVKESVKELHDQGLARGVRR